MRAFCIALLVACGNPPTDTVPPIPDAAENEDVHDVLACSGTTAIETYQCNPFSHIQCDLADEGSCYYYGAQDQWRCAPDGDRQIGDRCREPNDCVRGSTCFNCTCLEICTVQAPCSYGSCNIFFLEMWGVCE